MALLALQHPSAQLQQRGTPETPLTQGGDLSPAKHPTWGFFWSNPACSSGSLQNAYRAKPAGTTVSSHPEACQSLKELLVLSCTLRMSEPPRTTQTTSMLTKAGPQLLPLDSALISPLLPRLVDLQLNCPSGLVLGPPSLRLGQRVRSTCWPRPKLCWEALTDARRWTSTIPVAGDPRDRAPPALPAGERLRGCSQQHPPPP